MGIWQCLWKLADSKVLDLTLTTPPKSITAEATSWTSYLQVGFGSWTEHLYGLAISFPPKIYMSRSEYSWVSWFETSSGQLSLAIHSILCGAPNDFLAWFGIKCSSFSKMNIGTSMRSPFASIGCYDHPSVKMANGMLERTLPKHIPKWRWTKPRGLYAISNWCIYNWGIYILYYYYIIYTCFGSLFCLVNFGNHLYTIWTLLNWTNMLPFKDCPFDLLGDNTWGSMGIGTAIWIVARVLSGFSTYAGCNL